MNLSIRGFALAALAGLAVQTAAAQAQPDAGPVSARASLGIATDAGAALYAEAYEAQLAFRFDAAREAYRRLGAMEPESPASAYGLETMALWQALVEEHEPFVSRFYALNDSLTALADRLPDSPSTEYVRAAARLHRALAYGREERYTKAGWAFRDACGRFKSLARQPDPLPDALFGQGVCEVAAGAIPRQYRFLARLLGFSGTVKGGMELLRLAASGGGAASVDAVAALAIADATLNERRAGALDRLADLARARPDSPVLAYLEGYHLLLDRQAAEAEAVLRRAAAALEQPGVADLPFVDADLGTALFRQDRFAEAAPILERFARQFRGKALVAQATLRAGLAYEMAGDRRRAESLYRRVRSSREYDSDLAAVRDAERRLAAPMTRAERALLLGETAFDSGRYDEAVRALQPVVTGADLPQVQRAEAAYRTGRAYQALEVWDNAIRHYQLAVDKPGDAQAKWGPWALYHIGEVQEAEGRTAEARATYRAVLANEAEFDYHKSLEQRTRTALERIGS